MITLAQAAKWCGGRLLGPEDCGERFMTGVAIDSRKVGAGQLFVALPGERVDGRDFIPDAAKQGASAALRAPMDSDPAPDSAADADSNFTAVADADALPQIVAEDATQALGNLARGWREKMSDVTVIAVTGTNGKTSAREFAAWLLRREFGAEAVLTPPNNFNNRIGVPLTLLRLRVRHRFAVLELGMNRPGEIAELTRIARPDIGVITNAGRGHLAGLGTVENVARAKGELIENLPPDGLAILNARDPHFDMWAKMADGRQTQTFGAAPNDSPDTPDADFLNACAAVAAAQAAGATKPDVWRALAECRRPPGRMEIKRARGGAALVDDTYNANPDSALAALDFLRREPGQKIAALGDMLELGADSGKLHAEIGARAADDGIILFGFGEEARRMVEAAQAVGGRARHFADKEKLTAALAEFDRPGATILVKGSRGMKMEEVTRALRAPAAGKGGG